MMGIVHAKLKERKLQNVCVKSLENKRAENAIADYLLKSNDKNIVINDYMENEPLSEENLDKTLELVNRIRLSSPKKTIWLYTGYTWEEIIEYKYPEYVIDFSDPETRNAYNIYIREEIIKKCDIVVDGQYIESQQDIALSYRGSKQRVIDVQKSMQKGEVVLWID